MRVAWKKVMQEVVLVDDFAFYRSVPRNPPYLGIAAGCLVCLAVCVSLGVRLNLGKWQRCGQAVQYTGFIIDTFAFLEEERSKA